MAARRRSARIITVYVLSLVVALALLVYWIIFVVQSYAAINDYAARFGGTGSSYHWLALGIGCGLFVILIAGLTFQLAQALGERNYSRRQEEFVSNITHEMKSPLAAIKLHAQTLEEEDLGPEERAHSLRYVLQQVRRMETLVDNVLESSRLMARRRPLPLRPVALRPFFESYFAEIAPGVEQRGIRLAVSVETTATVLANTDGLYRIMTNLVENAVRFSDRGGEIRCSVADRDGEVVITVEDDGIGIPPTELKKVFDRFYQIGRELSERRGGTGLGLSIVQGLAREMRGRVRAHSHEGRRGTRFEVTLPMAGGAR